MNIIHMSITNVLQKNFIKKLTFLLVALPLMCFAAEATTTNKTPQIDVIATVNIYNATSTQSGHDFNISFDLSNRVGIQPDVRYGISLIRNVDGKVTIADEQVYSETLTLGENSTLYKTVHYLAPESLSGSYSLRLSSRNGGGIPLAIKSLGEVNLPVPKNGSVYIDPATCYQTLSGEKKTPHHSLSEILGVSKTDVLSVTCTIKNTTNNQVELSPKVNQYIRNAYGDLVVSKNNPLANLVLLKNEDKAVTVDIPQLNIPQDYLASVSFQDQTSHLETNKINTHYLLAGTGAAIRQVILDKDFYNKGDMAKVSFLWSIFDSSFLTSSSNQVKAADPVFVSLSLLDKNAAPCTSPFQQELTPIKGLVNLPILITANCLDPKIAISLTNKTGEILDSKNFSIISQPRPQAKVNVETSLTPNNDNTNLIALVALLLLLVLALFWKRIANAKNLPVAVLFLSMAFIGGAESVHADSAAVYYVCGVSPCPQATTIFFDSNLNQASYYPGQTVTLEVYVSSDDNPQSPSGVSPITRGNINSGAYSADAYPAIYTPQAIRNIVFGSTVLGVAPSVSGIVHTSYGSGGYGPKNSSIPLTVTQPPAPSPSLNLYFSLINQIKTFLRG